MLILESLSQHNQLGDSGLYFIYIIYYLTSRMFVHYACLCVLTRYYGNEAAYIFLHIKIHYCEPTC